MVRDLKIRTAAMTLSITAEIFVLHQGVAETSNHRQLWIPSSSNLADYQRLEEKPT